MTFKSKLLRLPPFDVPLFTYRAAEGSIVAGMQAQYGSANFLLGRIELAAISKVHSESPLPPPIVYPNPVHDEVHLGGMVKPITVIDALGRKLNVDQNSGILDISKLLRGVYFFVDNAGHRTRIVKE